MPYYMRVLRSFRNEEINEVLVAYLVFNSRSGNSIVAVFKGRETLSLCFRCDVLQYLHNSISFGCGNTL